MTILLRKLTEKSCLQEGKYANVPIGQLLQLGHTAYLRYVYFTFSMITFTDDILDRIYLNEEYRIEKPGKAPEMVEFLNKKLYRCMDLKKKSHVNKKYNAIKKDRDLYNEKIDKMTLSKYNLQRKNHNHYKEK